MLRVYLDNCCFNRPYDNQGDLLILGLKQKDAAHVACALFAHADYFLTTDKKLLNKGVHGIKIVNPIEFVRGYLDEQ